MTDHGERTDIDAATDEADSDRSTSGLTERGTWVVTPFVRLARLHASNSAADAMVAVALAGSLFFSIDPDAARWRVLLYLVLTIAPFSVVGPFIGPAIDRAPGGRRATMIVIMALRAVAALLMIPYIDSLLLFPVAFLNLVLGKSYSIAKASIVPTTVASESELVDKNSRLAVLTGVAGFLGAVPALLAQWLISAKVALALAALTYIVGVFMAWRLPRRQRAARPAEGDAAAEIRSAGITLSGSAMGVMRGIVGFMTFMIAFGFRGGTDDLDLSGMGAAVGAGVRNALGFTVDTGAVPAWQLGIVLACSAAGSLAGSVLAPRLRERTHEENLLLGALALITLVGLLSTWTGGLQGAGLLAMFVGFGASGSKVAFDAIVQRDAHDGDYAASFARFETRFQIAWVIGALIPVILRIPPRLGFFLIALAAILAGASFLVGIRTLATEGEGGRSRLLRRSINLEVPEWLGDSGDSDDSGEIDGTEGAASGQDEPAPAAVGARSAEGDETFEPLPPRETPAIVEQTPVPRSAFQPKAPPEKPSSPPMWDDHR